MPNMYELTTSRLWGFFFSIYNFVMVPKLLNLGIARSDRKTCKSDFGFDLRKIDTVYTVYNKSCVQSHGKDKTYLVYELLK